MKPETKQRFIRAFEESCVRAGSANLEEGLATFWKMLDWFNKQAESVRDRETLSASLDQLPEPSGAERALVLGAFEHLPAIVGYCIRDVAQQAKRDFPAPPGGRKYSLKAEDERGVCEHIGKLLADGYAMPVAKQSAASRYRTSVATVNRAWAHRKKPEQRKPRFRQILEYLKRP